MVPLNHFDHYVAERSVAATGVTAAVINSVPSASTSAQTRFIPPSLLLDSGDDDDNDSYEQNQMAHVQDEGTKTPSPLTLPTMDPLSEDNVSDSAGADEVGVTSDNSANQQPPSTNDDDALPDDTEDTPQDPHEPLERSLGPAAAMASEGLSGHLLASL